MSPGRADAREISRRDELSMAAYEIIADSGLDGLSIRALAHRVGATTGLVTHHFLDRSEIVAAALEYARNKMYARVQALGDASAFETLQATLPSDPDTARSWRVWIGVRAAALFDAEMARFHAEMYEQWRERLVVDLSDEAADHLMAVVDGIALRAALDFESWPPDRQLRHLQIAFDAVASDRTEGAKP